jgi:hypothetical protein
VIAGSVRVEFPIFAWRSGCCSMLIGVHLIVCDIPCGNCCWRGDTLLWKSFSGWMVQWVASIIHNEVLPCYSPEIGRAYRGNVFSLMPF